MSGAHNKRAQRAEALHEKARHESAKADLREVLSTAAGRRFVAKLLEDCYLTRSIFSTQALELARNAGRQAVGVQLRNYALQAAPDLFRRMEEEAAADRFEDTTTRQQARALPDPEAEPASSPSDEGENGDG